MIIEAAAALLHARGFERMTVDDVAAAAGVGKATVYRRWPSKDDLAVAAMGRLYTTEIPQPETGSILTDLVESYRAALAFVSSVQGQAYVRMSIAESVRDQRIAALYRQATERTEDRARELFHRAVERGEVRPDVDVDVCVQWLSGLIALRSITGRPLPTPEDAERLARVLLEGVLVRHS
jgi:AcrR family transcriptional regulator